MPILLLGQRLKECCASADSKQGKLTRTGYMTDLGIIINRNIKTYFSNHSASWYMVFNDILSSGSVYVNVGIFYAAKFSSEIKLILEFFVPVATYSWKNVTSIFITYITTITAVSESQNGDFI